MKEEAVLFGEKKSLVGIFTDPAVRQSGAGDVGVILLNPGIIHRVAPGRIYVKIARLLALLGFTAFRFDFSGIGDSKPRHDNLPFDKSSIDETQNAMDVLDVKRGIGRFILIGGCSGARVSFTTARCDPRVLGCILINYLSAGDDDDADAIPNPDLRKRKEEHHYLNLAIRNSLSWRKFFVGEAHYRKIFEALAFSFRRRFVTEKAILLDWLLFRQNLDAITSHGARPVFVCSQGDPCLDDLRRAGGHQLAELRARDKAELIAIPRSDHTFSSLFDQERLIKTVREKALDIVRRSIEAPTKPAPDIWVPTQLAPVPEQRPSVKSV